MLPKKNRLALRQEMPNLKRQGKLLQGNFFSLLYLIEQKELPKLAFVVSNKIEKKATARNRIRRWLSEATYPLLAQLPEGIKGVFLTKRSISGANLKEIEAEVKKILNEINN